MERTTPGTARQHSIRSPNVIWDWHSDNICGSYHLPYRWCRINLGWYVANGKINAEHRPTTFNTQNLNNICGSLIWIYIPGLCSFHSTHTKIILHHLRKETLSFLRWCRIILVCVEWKEQSPGIISTDNGQHRSTTFNTQNSNNICGSQILYIHVSASYSKMNILTWIY